MSDVLTTHVKVGVDTNTCVHVTAITDDPSVESVLGKIYYMLLYYNVHPYSNTSLIWCTVSLYRDMKCVSLDWGILLWFMIYVCSKYMYGHVCSQWCTEHQVIKEALWTINERIGQWTNYEPVCQMDILGHLIIYN